MGDRATSGLSRGLREEGGGGGMCPRIGTWGRAGWGSSQAGLCSGQVAAAVVGVGL